jgi:hypothetical protein
MERALPVLLILLVMGGLTAAMVVWIRKNRALFDRRDYRRLQARREQLFRAIGWGVVGLLVFAAMAGTVYVLNAGGTLAAVE